MPQPAVTYPAAFGHWHLRGGTLECRLPRKTVTVAAPSGLLSAVARLCNGQLAWREVAAELAERWDARQVDGFLLSLCSEGVLVESGELLAHWTDLGQAPALSPLLATDDELVALARSADSALLPGAASGTTALPKAATHLAEMLRRRRSHRTFADLPLPASTVSSILWAAAGVTRPDPSGGAHHRTIASGGNLHGMRWFAVVLRTLPGDGGEALDPGLYEAAFHAAGGCTLVPKSTDSHAPWGLVRDPRVLQFASAVLLPLAHIRTPSRKYGNRAALFAHIEAGESLQNAQLMACALGAAGVVRGDTLAAEVQRVLAPHMVGCPGPLLPMPAYVVGSAPTARQVALQEGERWIALQATPRRPDASGERQAWTAGPFPTAAGNILTVGRSRDPRLGIVKAEAEAWERLGWATLSGGERARAADVPGAIDPRRLLRYSDRQYQRAGFPFRAFDPAREHLWLAGHDACEGAAVQVTTDHVHAIAALPARMRTRPLASCSTSGVAAWSTAAKALERAALELIERDAFARSWIAGRALPLVDAQTLPADARSRVAALQEGGHRVAVLRLPCPLAAVFAVFVQRIDPPLTAITAAADFDAEAALDKALDEAEGRSALRPESGSSALRVRDATTPQDIHRLWQIPRVFRRADWYASGPKQESFTRPVTSACRDWTSLLDRLRARGSTVIAVDITPPGAAVHQGRTPLHVVRAFIPGTLPIWFQQGLEPAGLPAYAGARAHRIDRRGARASVPLHPFT